MSPHPMCSPPLTEKSAPATFYKHITKQSLALNRFEPKIFFQSLMNILKAHAADAPWRCWLALQRGSDAVSCPVSHLATHPAAHLAAHLKRNVIAHQGLIQYTHP
jgi:hypothetical protein